MNNREINSIENLEIKKVINNFEIRELWNYISFKTKKDEGELSLICGNLAQLYKDGIQIGEALDLVADTVTDKQYKKSLYEVLKLIKNGQCLSESFGKFPELYPKFFVGIIQIGENTGKLYEVLNELKTFYNKYISIKKQIKNSCTYPLFVLTSIIIIGILFANNIIPNFYDIYNSMNIKFPQLCQFIYDLTIELKTNPLVSAMTIISWVLILIIVGVYSYKNINMQKLIGVSIIRNFYEYMIVLLFSIVLTAGINISDALKYCEEGISSEFLKNKFRIINYGIKDGKSLSESIKTTNVFSKYSLAIIRAREEGGSIEKGFKELEKNLEGNLSEKLNKYIKSINPILMIIMSGLIIMFLFGLVLPLFNEIQNGIKK